jgi:hypothetical protein
MSLTATIVSFFCLLGVKSLFGLDVFPAWIVFLAVNAAPENAVICSSLAGFVIDALFYPGFVNFMSYTILGGVAVYLKRFFAFEEDTLQLMLVLIVSPLSVLLFAAGTMYFQGSAVMNLIPDMLKATVFNVLAMLLFNYFIRREHQS